MEVQLTVKSGDSISLNTNHEGSDLVVEVHDEHNMESTSISLTGVEVQVIRAAFDAIYQD